MPPAATTFTLYGIVHVTTLLAIGLASYGICRFAKRHAGDAGRIRRFDLVLGSVALLQWIIVQIAEARPSQFDVTYSLPIHICDLVGAAGALAILTRLRLFRALLYYWGVGLSIGALFLPELNVGVDHEKFWLFWIPHAFIIILAAYDLFARRYRPGWKDYGLAVATLLVYAAIMIPIDIAWTLNYGFVGPNAPGRPHMLDFLGEWPVRILKLGVAVLLFLAAITMPWLPRKPKPPQKQDRPPSPPRRRPMVDGLEDRISV